MTTSADVLWAPLPTLPLFSSSGHCFCARSGPSACPPLPTRSTFHFFQWKQITNLRTKILWAFEVRKTKVADFLQNKVFWSKIVNRKVLMNFQQINSIRRYVKTDRRFAAAVKSRKFSFILSSQQSFGAWCRIIVLDIGILTKFDNFTVWWLVSRYSIFDSHPTLGWVLSHKNILPSGKYILTIL